MQEKLIKLICATADLEQYYMCNCGCDDDIMEEFIYNLNKVFSSVDEIKKIAPYIKGLNLRIFTDENYKSGEFKDNIRDAIEDVFRSNIEPKKIVFDYDLVYQNIEYCCLLINYLENLSLEKLIALASKNPKVLYLIEGFSIDTLKQIIKNNSSTALIIDVDVMDDDSLCGTYLYKNRNTFLKDKELYDLYINGLKSSLKEDRMKYIYMSKIARNDISLAKFILDIDPKLIPYTEGSIRNNKEVMMKMISLDKENAYYLSDFLKNDLDIKKLLEIEYNKYYE